MPPDKPLSWTWPPPRLRPALALAGLFTLLALWQGCVALLTTRGDGGMVHWLEPFLWEGSSYLAVYLLLYIPYLAYANAPSTALGRGRFLAIHGAACLLMAALVPPLFLLFRHALWRILYLGSYDYGPLAFRLPMEWLKLVFAYVLGMGFALFLRHLKEQREGQARAAEQQAQLQAQLQEARLAALSAQLDPHFLFNALHTIGSLMYEDLERTDRLLASLARMLRDGLEAGGPLWPLAREREHLEAYADFARARFGDRLDLRVDLGAASPQALVPRFCLQRLVENSLKHQEGLRPLKVAVDALPPGEAWYLRVRDDGPGIADPRWALEGPSTGLRNLAETLRLQFGEAAELRIASPEAGGAEVSIRLPLEGAHA